MSPGWCYGLVDVAMSSWWCDMSVCTVVRSTLGFGCNVRDMIWVYRLWLSMGL